MSKTPRVEAIDIFCGIGGLTCGLGKAGITVRAGVDLDEKCRYAYETNNHTEFIHEDVANITAQEVVSRFSKDTIRVLAGCAPCQPFSAYTRRYRESSAHGKEWGLLSHFGRLVREILPDIVTMENVPALRHEEVFAEFLQILEANGYYCTWEIVDSADYGVPQHRERIVLLASQFGSIHLMTPEELRIPTLTVRQAIGSLPPLSHGETDPTDPMHSAARLSALNLERIQNSVPGGTWMRWPDHLQLQCHKKRNGRTYKSVYGRMNPDAPSPTITTQFYGYGNGRFGHPEQDRAISLREGALLQSFPSDYVFVPEGAPICRKIVGKQIGNAVPVKLAECVGMSILRHIEMR